MAHNLVQSDFRVAVPESNIRAADLATILGAVTWMYDGLAAVFLPEFGSFAHRRAEVASDNEAALRVTKLVSGSDIKISLFGDEKPIEALRKILEDIRFWKERREQKEEEAKQSREKTAQEREKTQQMRLENVHRLLGVYKEIKDMSPEDRKEFFRMMNDAASALAENRNTLLPQ